MSTEYLNLVTSQYRNSPNFINWLTATLEKLNNITDAAGDLNSAFDITSAIGLQLDVIGAIVGQSRIVGFEPTDKSSPILNDDIYRVLLKAKIVKNQWSGQVADVDALWQLLFPEGAVIIEDEQNMSIIVSVGGKLTLTERDLVIEGYMVPKPEGVQVNYNFGTLLPFFGYDLDNKYISGYDKGYWTMMHEKQNTPVFSYDNGFRGYDKGNWD